MSPFGLHGAHRARAASSGQPKNWYICPHFGHFCTRLSEEKTCIWSLIKESGVLYIWPISPNGLHGAHGARAASSCQPKNWYICPTLAVFVHGYQKKRLVYAPWLIRVVYYIYDLSPQMGYTVHTGLYLSSALKIWCMSSISYTLHTGLKLPAQL